MLNNLPQMSLKLSSKKAIQKTVIGNKIADKIKKVSKNSQ